MLRRFLLALVMLASGIGPLSATQAPLVTPGPPLPMTGLATFLNNALLTLGSCSSGVAAPTPVSAAPITYQCWVDTSGTLKLMKIYDGTSWITVGTIDAAAHTYTSNAAIGLTSAHIFVGNSSGVATDVAMSGDATMANTGALTIANAAVTYAKIQNLGALAVMGRSANTSGVGANIQASAASDAVLRESGSTIGFGTVATGGIANNAVTLAKLATQATNTVLGNATSGTAVPTALTVVSCSTAGSALIWTTNTGFGCNTSITAGGVNVGGITGLGTGVATALAVNVGSAGAFVTFNGALGTPSSGTLTNATGLPTSGLTGTLQAAQEPAHTGDVTNSAGSLALTIAANAVTLAKLATQATNTILGNATSGTAVPTALAIGSCDTATKALQWTTNTGFACNSSINAATLGGATFSAPGAIGGGTPSTGAFTTLSATTSLSVANTSATAGLNVVDIAKDWSATGATNIMASFTAYADAARFVIRNAGGTAASPSATVSGAIGNINFRGYYTSGGTGFTTGVASITANAIGTFTSTDWGSTLTLSTIPAGTASLVQAVQIQGSGGVSIGTTTDPGTGSLQLNAQAFMPNMASDTATVDSTVCTATTGGKLLKGTGALGICLGTSGRQFKTGFVPMTAGLDDLIQIKLWNYRYRSGYGDGGAAMQYGTTAQEIEAVIPDLARHNAAGETINYDSGALLFIGLRAIQQLKADNDNLRAEISALRHASK